ncbi:lipase family protein [Shewanella nanhaiensis]|uniref:DUF2974 domain-containing protein n=1 Tax=Shewanella nanhaiensis TaxID=2864872 RepID=A0ABS7E7M4_9GAMM|nr:Mbeg1-like protein [Shewanella nanhaiensis]MBW8185022.1 DUF2974 domain-containing protein [Shewanella nanhaiensis]
MKCQKIAPLTLCLTLLSMPMFATASVTQNDINNVGAYINAVLVPNFTDTQNQTGTTYKTHQPTSINQARSALYYLNFAEQVNSAYGAPRGWQRVENISYSSGFYASVYQKDADIIVAFRGSELGTSDWVTNGIMVQDIVPAQYQQAIDESSRLKVKYRNSSIHYTGHSLGGGLATAAAITTGDAATVFDASGLADAVLTRIKQTLSAAGSADNAWHTHAGKVTNFNLEGEFVSDIDLQQDADTLGDTSRQYGDIFYLSDDRFTPFYLVDNGLSRHFTTPLKEELQFLSQPVFRNNPYDHDSIDNDLNPNTSFFYLDLTDDTLDILLWQFSFSINSLPSLLDDLNL